MAAHRHTPDIRRAAPDFFRASLITRQFASHISSISRSVKPGWGTSIFVAVLAVAISFPFASKMAAFVVVPPLSRPT